LIQQQSVNVIYWFGIDVGKKLVENNIQILTTEYYYYILSMCSSPSAGICYVWTQCQFPIFYVFSFYCSVFTIQLQQIKL